MSDDGPSLDTVTDAIERCQDHAREHFDPEAFENGDWFTNTTMWSDGDFRVEVKHGMGYTQDPYCQEAELVVYDHFEGRTAYVHLTRYPNLTRKEEMHEHEVLETPDRGNA